VNLDVTLAEEEAEEDAEAPEEAEVWNADASVLVAVANVPEPLFNWLCTFTGSEAVAIDSRARTKSSGYVEPVFFIVVIVSQLLRSRFCACFKQAK
jgi:hypothetical protein